jgi:inhibitor of cysteine peptidase
VPQVGPVRIPLPNLPNILNTKIILWVGMVVASVNALTAAEPTATALIKTLTETDNGVAVALTSKSRLMIRLPAQAGTGYSWTPKSASSLLRLVKSYVEAPAHMLPGGTEHQVFVFRPVASGTDELEIDYRRPWEHGGAPARVFRFTATVQSGKGER